LGEELVREILATVERTDGPTVLIVDESYIRADLDGEVQ
jgi:hypothetical protein